MEINNNEPNLVNEYKDWYDQIITISKEHNFGLYEKLNRSDEKIQNLPNKNEKNSMLLCKRSLPKMVKSLYELKDINGNFKTEKAIKTITNTIKESPSNPLIFIAKLAQDSFLAGVESNNVMANLMPKDFLETQNNKDFNKSLIKIVLKRAPNLYQKYMRADRKTRIDNNIASLNFR
jgi:hypothetical protein